MGNGSAIGALNRWLKAPFISGEMRHYPLAIWLLPFVVMATCARRSSDPQSSGSGGSAAAGGAEGGAEPFDATVPFDRDLSDVSFVYEGPEDDGSVNRDAACVAEFVPALPAALDMYLMVDRSQTMGADCNVGSSKTSPWCFSVNALAGFFAAHTSNGMAVALGFTPHGACTWTDRANNEQNCCAGGDCCTGDDDLVPEVELAELPRQLENLVAKLNEQAPTGTTSPIEAALRGLTRYTAKSKRENRHMAGIFMTDGEPNGCDRNLTTLAKILSDHRAATGQLTFVIGMTGADYSALEKLAVAGGATPHANYCAKGASSCHYYDVGDGNPSAFVDALQQIQRSTVGCHFTLPESDAGIVDPKTLVVEWTSSGASGSTRLKRLQSMNDCGEGWYPDADNAGQFVLCEATCRSVQSQPQVQVNILAGCLGA